MYNFETSISEVLSVINDSNWHSLFSIHQRYGLNPVEIYEAVKFLEELGLVEIRGKEICLAKTIETDALARIRHLLLKRKFSLEPLQELSYNEAVLSINEPYLPIIDLLDDSLMVCAAKEEV